MGSAPASLETVPEGGAVQAPQYSPAQTNIVGRETASYGPTSPLLYLFTDLRSLSHTHDAAPTEVEVILNKLGYPPSVVEIVVKFRVVTREELIARMKEEAWKIKWELGMHKVPLSKSSYAPAKPRTPSTLDLPSPSVGFLERSKQTWPQRRPRKESIDDMYTELPRSLRAESKKAKEHKPVSFSESALHIKKLTHSRSFSEPDKPIFHQPHFGDCCSTHVKHSHGRHNHKSRVLKSYGFTDEGHDTRSDLDSTFSPLSRKPLHKMSLREQYQRLNRFNDSNVSKKT